MRIRLWMIGLAVAIGLLVLLVTWLAMPPGGSGATTPDAPEDRSDSTQPLDRLPPVSDAEEPDKEGPDEDAPSPRLPESVSLEFEPTSLAVQYDYDQRRSVALRNTGSETVQVRVHAESPPGLFAGFVGRGSEDWYEPSTVAMEPGETWPFPFVVHAHAADRDTYQVPVTASVRVDDVEVTAARASITVEVQRPRLSIEASWSEPEAAGDQARLVRILHVTNTGPNVPDLTLTVVGPDGQSAPRTIAYTSPVVEGVRLDHGDSIAVRVWPRFTRDFRAAEGLAIVHGLGQSIELAYVASVPEGQQVYFAISRSTGRSSNTGSRCTNVRDVAYTHPATAGTPSDQPSEWFGDESDLTSGAVARDPGEPSFRIHDDDVFRFDDPPDDSRELDALEAESSDIEGTLPPESNGSEPPVRTIDLPLGLPPQVPESEEENDNEDGHDESDDDEAFEDEQGALPSNADGTMVIGFPPTGDARHGKDRPAAYFRDSVFNSKVKLAYRDSRGFAAVIVRHRASGSWLTVYERDAAGESQRRRVDLVRGEARVLQPALGRSLDGRLLVAWTTPIGTGRSRITIAEAFGERRIQLGRSSTATTSPFFVAGDGVLELVYLDGNVLMRTALSASLDADPQQLYLPGAEERIEHVYSVRRAPDGTLAALLATDAEHVQLIREGVATRVLEGTAGDFAYLTGSEALVLVVRRSDGSIHDVSHGQSHELIPPGERRGPPVLVAAADGLRLYVHDAAGDATQHVREGTWRRTRTSAGEWSEERLVAQSESPVVAAAVVLEFAMPWQWAQYKEMNTVVLLNGREIGRLERHVPSGRYFFPVPVDALNYEPTASSEATSPARNVVRLKIEGIGRGNFLVTDRCDIYTFHSLVQEYVVAASAEQARELVLASRPELRHDQPDLLLASNAWTMPRGVQPGDSMEAHVFMVNVGDAPVPAGQLRATDSTGASRGRTGYAPLAPGEQRIVPVPLSMPASWDRDRPLAIEIHADVPGDAAPANNVLRFVALREPDEELAGPRRPRQVDLQRLPQIETIDSTPTQEQPSEFQGQAIASWYRLRVPDVGELQVEIRGLPGELLLGIEPFGSDGLPLADTDGVWRIKSDYLYLRVNLKPGRRVPPTATLRMWWE